MVTSENPAVPQARIPSFLVALGAGFSRHEYRLVAEEVVLGRDGRLCDIVSAGSMVSRQHAKLVRGLEGSYCLEDLHSTNGLFVNGDRICDHRVLEEGDLIGLGTPVPLLRFQQHSSREPRRLLLPPREQWIIGRDPACDLPLAGEATVSARHAIVRRDHDRLHLVDNHSLNGTWINGRKRRHADLGPADRVMVGSTLFGFLLTEKGELQVEQQDCGQSVRLECVNLSRWASPARDRRLLEAITLAVAPGEFVGILGPSGAGKTTLLTALTGDRPPDQGWVLCNGTVLERSSRLFRNTIGYVPQDDILHQELSVEACLEYIARLRLSPDLTNEQRAEIIDGTIETLALEQVRHLSIGQLSGGQRKRVSLGAELLVRPGLLLLDEPTAGLDPATEQQLMRHFRAMADQGTTVVITTHLLTNLDLLDKVAICAQGQLVFFGPPGEALAFFGGPEGPLAEPTQIFTVLTGEKRACRPESEDEIARGHAERFRHSAAWSEHVDARLSPEARTLADAAIDSVSLPPAPWPRRLRGLLHALIEGCSPLPALRSWSILSQRHLKIRLGSCKRLLLFLLVPVVLALVTLAQPIIGFVDDATVRARRAEIDAALAQGGAVVERQLKLLLASPEDHRARSAAELVYGLRYEGPANLPVPMGGVLMLVMSAAFCGTLIASLEISGERPIYRRERRSHLRILPYIASKLPFCFLLTTLQCLAFLLVCQLHPVFRQVDLVSLWLTMTSVAWSSVALGLLLSALDPSDGRFAVMSAVAVVLPQLLLSGGIGPEFYQGMSKGMRLLADVLPSRWGVEMACFALFGPVGGEGAGWLPGFVRDSIGFDFGPEVYYNGASVLLGQFILWLLVCAGILFFRDYRRC